MRARGAVMTLISDISPSMLADGAFSDDGLLLYCNQRYFHAWPRRTTADARLRWCDIAGDQQRLA